jgi:hypothetical protein
MALYDLIVILSASHNFSIELANAAQEEPSDGWTRTLAARFPWIATGPATSTPPLISSNTGVSGGRARGT